MATAAVSSVAVITQLALDAVVFRRSGRSWISGTTSVCMRAPVMPATESTKTMALDETVDGSGAVTWSGAWEVTMCTIHILCILHTLCTLHFDVPARRGVGSTME